MVKPAPENPAPTGSGQTLLDLENPSDACDFGYDLASARSQLPAGSSAEKGTVQGRPFDPADHWGKEL